MLRYWNGSLSDDKVQDIAHTFAQIVSEIAADPNVKLSALNKCSKRDLQQLQVWNQDQFPAIDACIHDLVHEHNISHPQADALSAWDGHMSHHDLDETASLLAQHILETSPHTKADNIIPICFEKSIWQPVSMLATMKAGAAFVSIDAAHPVGRLRSIVDSVQAKVVLCSGEHRDLCLSLVDSVIVVDYPLLKSLQARERKMIMPRATPADAAYAIFTSGSTGTPKGIVINHQAYASNVRVQQERMNIDRTTRSLQFASHVFDASILEILTVLTAGGCVCIPSPEDRMNNTARFVTDMQVNWAILTPSFAKLLQPKDFPALKTLVSGGEALSTTVLQNWAPAVNLVNAYGPSECSISGVINSNVTEDTSPTDVGRGAGALTWIVDPANHDCLLPVGAVGELLLEGPIIGRGRFS